MTGTVTRARESGIELARMLATLGWVVFASAAVIAGLGALPGWLAGEGAGVRRATTVEEAERRLGARLILPAVYPERLAWPPTEIRVADGRGGSVALTFTDRAGLPAVQLLESTADGAPIAPRLLGERSVLGASPTTIGSRPATLSSVLIEGEPWRELAWELRGREFVLRTRGEVDELYRMAHSAHREESR